jgi:hypothetical protein
MNYPSYTCKLRFEHPLILKTDEPDAVLTLKQSLRKAVELLGDEAMGVELRPLAHKTAGKDVRWFFHLFSDADFQHLENRGPVFGPALEVVTAPGWWEVEDYAGGKVIVRAYSNLDAICRVADSNPGVSFSETQFAGPSLVLPMIEREPEPGRLEAACLEASTKGGDSFLLLDVVCPEHFQFHLPEPVPGMEAGEIIQKLILDQLTSGCGDRLTSSSGKLFDLKIHGWHDAKGEYHSLWHVYRFPERAFGTRLREKFCDDTPQRGWHFFGKFDQRLVWGNSTADAARTLFQHHFPVWSVRPIPDGAVLYGT